MSIFLDTMFLFAAEMEEPKIGILGKGLTLYQTVPSFNSPLEKVLANIMEKGENPGNQHSLHFPQCFLSLPNQISIFNPHFFKWHADAFMLDNSRIFSLGEELTQYHTMMT